MILFLLTWFYPLLYVYSKMTPNHPTIKSANQIIFHFITLQNQQTKRKKENELLLGAFILFLFS